MNLKFFSVAISSAVCQALSIDISMGSKLALSAGSQRDCNASFQRNNGKLQDFETIVKGSAKFVDETFPANESALQWAQHNERVFSEDASENQAELNKVHWRRAQDIGKLSKGYGEFKLWNSNGISPLDVRQGGLGDCWFLAAASALAEKPGRIEKLFHNKGGNLNQAGIYALDLYALGVPHTIIIDDYLPVKWDENLKAFQTIFSEIPPNDQSMWVPLLEKAMAKFSGNYKHVEGGYGPMAIQTMAGMPRKYFQHERFDQNYLWGEISKARSLQDIVTADTPIHP